MLYMVFHPVKNFHCHAIFLTSQFPGILQSDILPISSMGQAYFQSMTQNLQLCMMLLLQVYSIPV